MFTPTMQTNRLYDPIEIRARPVRKGHQPHISGAGKHDSRPKRERTRGAQLRKVLREEG